jgi:hypothetical protein
MSRLEYRLLDEARQYPLLYFYAEIEKAEIALRNACDYFVKDGTEYEKTSCAIEHTLYIIYVKAADGERALDSDQGRTTAWSGIRLELRAYRENAIHYEIVQTFDFSAKEDLLLYLQSDFLFLQGKEWEKTSAEIDEDRKVYVYYAQEVRNDG